MVSPSHPRFDRLVLSSTRRPHGANHHSEMIIHLIVLKCIKLILESDLKINICAICKLFSSMNGFDITAHYARIRFLYFVLWLMKHYHQIIVIMVIESKCVWRINVSIVLVFVDDQKTTRYVHDHCK